jgi:L-rhamnonate dehydratase
MKITDLKLRQLQGTMEYQGTLWEERGARPVDIYPAFRQQNAEDTVRKQFPSAGDNLYRVTQTFLTIETDEGVTGVVGPLTGDATAFYLATQLKTLLIGHNPLWDIKGKWLNQPVHALLGGPVQDKIPAYASTAGFSLEPDKAAERVRMIKNEGYCGSKWFFRRGVGDGKEGEKKNVELMRSLREASGPDMQVMIDAWANWGVPYTLRMADLLKEYDPAWIEEPLQYVLHDSYLQLKCESPIPIAGGEHEFTRWGVKALLDQDILDIYQFEPIWAGGMSELMKINALVSSYDATFIPHVYVPAASAQVAFTLNAMTTPMLEYHYILGEIYQFFLEQPVKPKQGYFYPPEAPGIGITIDENKVESEKELTFG